MSTVYESTVDTLREVGERLAHDVPRLAHDVPSSLASVRIPSAVSEVVSEALNDWPDDLVDRFGGGRSTRWQTPVFVAGGVIAVILAVAWFVRRRRNADAETHLSVADQTSAAGAA